MDGQRQVLVIGAGVLGLLAAVACSAQGWPVTVLERGPIPNPESTSYDQHRIVRALHLHDPVATRAGARAWQQWRAVERRLKTHLLHRTGVVTGLAAEEVAPATAALAAAGADGEVLTARGVRTRWPHLRPATPWAILEPDAGVVLADRALRALARSLAEDPLVSLRPHHEVTGVDPVSRTVRVATTTWRASRILVTAGVQSRRLAGAATSVPVDIRRQSVLYCRVPVELRGAYRDTPAVLRLSPRSGSWLVPPIASTRLKLSASVACRTVPTVRDHATAAHWRGSLVEIFRRQLAGFSTTWVASARDCYYAGAGERGGARVVALAPGVLAHLACGGGSFKFAPAVAGALARDVLAGTTTGDGGDLGGPDG